MRGDEVNIYMKKKRGRRKKECSDIRGKKNTSFGA